MSLSRSQTLELQNALRQAVVACSQRCLYQSARWAAELLDSLPVGDEDDASLCNSGHFENPALQMDASESLLELTETPKYLMAKAFFDCHEFQRCAEALLPSSPSALSIAFPKGKAARRPRKGISQRGLFLACYALLIQGEKEKTEDASLVLGPSDTGTVTNKQLPEIRSVLEKWLTREKTSSGRGSSQGWLEYLYGMVLAKDQMNDLAKSWLLKSVSVNPWNWGAWQELRCLVRDAKDAMVFYRMKGGLVLAFFAASSSYVIIDFESARSVFSDLLISHPRYLDLLDHYSNVLYGLNSKDGLSFIAQVASSVEPYRPETCCVIGNYYSLSSRHEDAVIYFRRALVLDRSFASAWTLLGHEYLKLENSHAALSSYFRAIRLNKQDYKAYFGLGQVYEFFGQPRMSLGFYRQAVLLHPEEVNLWQAMADCLESLSRLPQAVNSLKRALACTDSALRPPEGYIGDTSLLVNRRLDIHFRLACFYEELDDRQEATTSLEICLDEAKEYYSRKNVEGNTDDEHSAIISKAQLLLARWALDSGDHARAQRFASQVRQPGEARDEAQGLLDACALGFDMDID
ncbi:hypothetical protein O1611_g814 [Lasiodiplodia mahajangana]|uniref:Uncharacterized protein n=1 Tax=Lasiodiplodia mahajangana TaxID=1108764 RepID=A0ACC2JZA5_9PEZI|nr:hypothetical protein O1611_g814 [Lasiodiplodia mahajangana]